MKNKSAFTLAEVLITLGIIGVVASLTIPGMLNNTNKKELRESFKKTYSNLASATEVMEQDNNETLVNVFTTNTGDIKNQYKNYLKVTKSCDNSSSDGCWHTAQKWTQYDKTKNGAVTYPGLVLVDGTLLVFEDTYFSATCTASTITSLTNVCGDIMIDVNGFKNPNVIGKDIFYIWILSNAIKPWGNDKDSGIALSSTCATGQGGWGCASNVLNNVDY